LNETLNGPPIQVARPRRSCFRPCDLKEDGCECVGKLNLSHVDFPYMGVRVKSEYEYVRTNLVNSCNENTEALVILSEEFNKVDGAGKLAVGQQEEFIAQNTEESNEDSMEREVAGGEQGQTESSNLKTSEIEGEENLIPADQEERSQPSNAASTNNDKGEFQGHVGNERFEEENDIELSMVTLLQTSQIEVLPHASKRQDVALCVIRRPNDNYPNMIENTKKFIIDPYAADVFLLPYIPKERIIFKLKKSGFTMANGDGGWVHPDWNEDDRGIFEAAWYYNQCHEEIVRYERETGKLTPYNFIILSRADIACVAEPFCISTQETVLIPRVPKRNISKEEEPYRHLIVESMTDHMLASPRAFADEILPYMYRALTTNNDILGVFGEDGLCGNFHVGSFFKWMRYSAQFVAQKLFYPGEYKFGRPSSVCFRVCEMEETSCIHVSGLEFPGLGVRDEAEYQLATKNKGKTCLVPPGPPLILDAGENDVTAITYFERYKIRRNLYVISFHFI